MEKQTFQIKLFAILFFTALSFFSCEKDEVIQETKEKAIVLEDIDIDEAKEILKETFPITKSGDFLIRPDFSKIVQQSFNNSSNKITIAPVEIRGEKDGYHRIYLLKKDERVYKMICSMYSTDSRATTTFTGIILMRNIDGSFREAARFQNDKMVSYFEKKIQTRSFGYTAGESLIYLNERFFV